MIYDIITVGGGPAGLCAAVYAGRAGKSVLVLEREAFGGQIVYSPLVENYPGVAAVSGPDFADELISQAKKFGAELKRGTVTSVEREGELIAVRTKRGDFLSRAVIIAAGSRHRELGVDREREFVGSGVSYCAVCDGAFFKGKVTAVVGGGNTAFQDALYLSAGCGKVYLIHRRTSFRADASLVERAKETENIELITPATVEKLNGGARLESVTVRFGDGSSAGLECAGLFVAVGQEPQNAPFADILPLDSAGYVDIGEGLCAGDGIFVAGDCRRKALRQLTTAVGDGAQAAVAACEYIDAAFAR